MWAYLESNQEKEAPRMASRPVGEESGKTRESKGLRRKSSHGLASPPYQAGISSCSVPGVYTRDAGGRPAGASSPMYVVCPPAEPFARSRPAR